MNSMERMVKCLQYEEADRVPVYPVLGGCVRHLVGQYFTVWSKIAEVCENVFINGDTVEGASNITDGIVFNGSISGEEYQSFVVFGTAPVVGGTAIDEAILKRLYKDFGYEYTEETAYGIGTPDRPLEISSYEHILAINGYMNLDFAFGLNADEIDMSEYESTVAVTKVFNGTLTTKSGASGTRYIKLSNFAGNS